MNAAEWHGTKQTTKLCLTWDSNMQLGINQLQACAFPGQVSGYLYHKLLGQCLKMLWKSLRLIGQLGEVMMWSLRPFARAEVGRSWSKFLAMFQQKGRWRFGIQECQVVPSCWGANVPKHFTAPNLPQLNHSQVLPLALGANRFSRIMTDDGSCVKRSLCRQCRHMSTVSSVDCLDQVYAVRKALSNPLCLIQGPPGVMGGHLQRVAGVFFLSQIFFTE